VLFCAWATLVVLLIENHSGCEDERQTLYQTDFRPWAFAPRPVACPDQIDAARLAHPQSCLVLSKSSRSDTVVISIHSLEFKVGFGPTFCGADGESTLLFEQTAPRYRSFEVQVPALCDARGACCGHWRSGAVLGPFLRWRGFLPHVFVHVRDSWPKARTRVGGVVGL
jgi:hypothetical protein